MTTSPSEAPRLIGYTNYEPRTLYIDTEITHPLASPMLVGQRGSEVYLDAAIDKIYQQLKQELKDRDAYSLEFQEDRTGTIHTLKIRGKFIYLNEIH